MLTFFVLSATTLLAVRITDRARKARFPFNSDIAVNLAAAATPPSMSTKS